MLKQIQSGSYSSGNQPSEDVCGYVADNKSVHAWVIDGATGISPSLMLAPDHSDAEWYALRINWHLHRAIVCHGGSHDSDMLLASAIDAANADFRALINDREADAHLLPSASVILAKVQRQSGGYLVGFAKLGDCCGVLRTGPGQAHIVESTLGPSFDLEFDALAARLAQTDGDSERRSAILAEISRRLLVRRKTMNQPGGYAIAAPNWDSSTLGFESFHSIEPPSLMLLSDGAARLVEKYRACTYEEALDEVFRIGGVGLIRKIREIERHDRTCQSWPRLKTSDDATIVALQVGAHVR
ncbi:hypothetical protein [Cupriavidus malaysiensis]|uniref:Protein phosphatase 2C domain-containing protein n=1 Tax=Cupriavidus malaysiensis TaxID=367825 RepID=A0ABN4TT71_9BURK|nr:hypothetical protein [Cupriavidus malaysiensis]AOZ10457.1 hypothetical protein BKK80_33330 [Cupriavidus malaysiensis]